MKIIFKQEDVCREIGAGDLSRGKDYFLRNKVLKSSVSHDGIEITSKVSGSRGRIYEAIIVIQNTILIHYAFK